MSLFNRTITSSRHANTTLFPVPPARTADAAMNLANLVGQAEVDAIELFGTMQFHVTSDTGVATLQQDEVVQAMTRDLDVHNPAQAPSFFLNLGDVIYGPGKKDAYHDRFYQPNIPYLQPAPGMQGVILAVPGNHDGDLVEAGNAPGNGNLDAFLENFVLPNPPLAVQFGVAMPQQPGVYWILRAPFVDIVGLYSNAGEYDGALGVDAGDRLQRDWLSTTLQTIAAGPRRALVLAVHHPPYALGLEEPGPGRPGHAGSPAMQADLDAACAAAGIWPDAVVSGHSHNYQRYLRTATIAVSNTTFDTAYFVAGTGGIGSQAVPTAAIGNAQDETVPGLSSSRVIFKNKLKSYGYLRVAATATWLKITFVATDSNHRSEFETVTMDLATHRQVTP
jgi:hypothetical protein